MIKIKTIDFSNGDLNIKSKRLNLLENKEQKIQKTKSYLLTVKNELFYNNNIGLEYTEILDVKEKNIEDDRKRIAIMEALSQDENIEKIEEIIIENDAESRKQRISLKLKYKSENEITTIGGVPIG